MQGHGTNIAIEAAAEHMIDANFETLLANKRYNAITFQSSAY